MDIQAEKIELVKLLLNTDNPKIIESIKQIFKKEKNDFWDDLSAEQQSEIELGLHQINEGKVTDYETIMKKHR
ncbi:MULTISPECIES: hypothetical protein [unclassified Lacinutrix]|uniref:hypothetical protein n=1 Tax=Lacinutrix sp. WUR7 TaxID=2653681 RepID=UPI00193CBBE8|nr:hypothetical protein [Lacinutrix sp. WUR7]QRM88852.1 hypothetical protein FG167_06260 [Lacinutrix sp. WUR7]